MHPMFRYIWENEFFFTGDKDGIVFAITYFRKCPHKTRAIALRGWGQSFLSKDMILIFQMRKLLLKTVIWQTSCTKIPGYKSSLQEQLYNPPPPHPEKSEKPLQQ
jgi:hypothetical protein